jgi:hypothetical protein
MGAPTPEHMRAVIDAHVAAWNAGDKDAWLAGLQAAFPGGITMEDPVGTPVKRGWQIMGDAWDASPNADWTLTVERLITCGNEVATVMRSDGTVQGAPVSVVSIETVRFEPDGSVHWKTYLELPDGSEYADWTSQTGD